MDIRSQYHARTPRVSHRAMVASLCERAAARGMNPENIPNICADERRVWIAERLAERRAPLRVEIDQTRTPHGEAVYRHAVYEISETRIGYYRVRYCDDRGTDRTAYDGDLEAAVLAIGTVDDLSAVTRAVLRRRLAYVRTVGEFNRPDVRRWSVVHRRGAPTFKSRRGAIAFLRRVWRGDV